MFGVGLALTSGALVAAARVAPRAGRGLEVGVLVAAGVLATAVRFVLFRSWVFPGTPAPTPADLSPPTPRSSR